jgi:FG-GAP-like repeat/FG-GAP repeat
MKAVLPVVLVTLILCGNLLAATNPVPFVNQPLVPDAVQPGGSGFTLTVNGTGFVSGSVVNWNKSPRTTTFVSSSQLTATISSSDIATPNTAVVTVVNPGPGGGNSNVANFAVALPSPGIATLSNSVGINNNLNVSAEVAGDFNGDGNLDVAVSANDPNGGESKVAILLGNGDGTFRRASTIPIQFFAGNLITGDFNADGKLDLALITNLNQVSVLLGNGDGTFQPEKDYLTGISPISILVGDFNQDGNLDLATSNSTDNSVSVLLGKGDGTFLAHVDSPTGGVSTDGFTVGDFNSDGKLDLAVAESASSEVTILLGNGDGTFSFGTELFSLDSPSAVATADLNGDGKLDLIVGNANFNGIGSWETVFFGNGDGTFQKGQVVSQSQRLLPEQTATVADMNADGHPDLVILSGTPNDDGNISLLLGDGTGAFKFA